MGAHVIALDISPTRLERSVQFGAVATLDPSKVDSVGDAIRDLSGGRGVSKSLETSGASSAARAALDVLDLWGSVCWVGVGPTINFDLSDHLYRQITAMTSWTMSIPDMENCARFVVERRVDVDALFSERWSLGKAKEAYELFDMQTSGKGVFVPEGP
ncbi:zinc-binding dehydrogenase [Pseudarthrobacter oxydans]|jgi:threonine dehydrogenase-like Zn-dependent dehydrogenase|uniref:zinc-binding dehydrogenase n=1 Tax=Pseudarthrobacter oxydans TaxID=1671 RepID=UPI002AA877E7|nr:zinc-binding dehydrogenase [Pseudarthrobacter oxydans]WPU09496.1 zinc-binding dehydrogenase [Pseudarthrobacter oxydans]